MADSGVPFALDASNVALVEDLSDIPVGESATIEVLLTGLLASDDPQTMALAIKASPEDSDLATSTILATITQTLAAAGVITATDDPTVWRGTFVLTRQQGVRISRQSTFTYTVRATVDRGGSDYTRMVQRGAIRATLFSIDDDAPMADGEWFADGSLYASGFDN